MMSKGFLQILLSVIILLMVTISACTPSRISVAEYNKGTPGGDESPGEVQETSPPTEEPDPIEQVPVVVTEPAGPAEDTPIPDGAYDVQVSRGGASIHFQIDGAIEDVVTYYQDVLPDFEWELAGPPDNAIGSIATMLRENEIGDRLAINMQANELGGFVQVTITVSRAG